METISIFICDNQSLTQKGIISILMKYFNNNVIFTELSSKSTLTELLQTNPPHLVIIDFDFFDFNDITELSLIKKIAPETGILVITDNKLPNAITKTVNAGINNYLLKTCTNNELIDAVNATLNNKKYFSTDILEVLIDKKTSARNSDEPVKLTNTEIEIVRLIASGLTTKEIADKRNLSFHTIITHRKNIFRKLSINSTSELMMYAMRNGIIDTLEYYI